MVTNVDAGGLFSCHHKNIISVTLRSIYVLNQTKNLRNVKIQIRETWVTNYFYNFNGSHLQIYLKSIFSRILENFDLNYGKEPISGITDAAL